MSELDSLILDLLEWIGLESRPYSEVMNAWRTSCPRLTVWEDACDRGFIEHSNARVTVTALGQQFLAERRLTQ